MKCTKQIFFVIFGHFLPFDPPPPYPLLTAWKIKIFKNMKKTPGDIIILHKCTKNHDHRLYCSWGMARDRCNYFSFWGIFCPFTPITAQKMKIPIKWKKPGDTIILRNGTLFFILDYFLITLFNHFPRIRIFVYYVKNLEENSTKLF